MVCALYFSSDGSALLILPLVNGFPASLCVVLLCGWQRIADTSARQHLSRRFARLIPQQMMADCTFFLSSTAFPTVCAPYCSVDGSGFLILLLVNGFSDGLGAVLLSGWQGIAHSSACQRLSPRFARRIALRLAAHCLFLHSLTALPTVGAPYCSADGSGLLILTLVDGFHDRLRAVLLHRWQRIAHTSARQQRSCQFARRIAQQMAAYCSFLPSSTAFPPVCTSYCSADGSVLLILPLVNGFSDSLCAVLLRGWRPIVHCFSYQLLS